MKADVHSKALGMVVFSNLSPDLYTALLRARQSANLCGIDPDDIEVTPAADATISRELNRYGEQWYVDSDKVSAVAPKPMPTEVSSPGPSL